MFVSWRQCEEVVLSMENSKKAQSSLLHIISMRMVGVRNNIPGAEGNVK